MKDIAGSFKMNGDLVADACTGKLVVVKACVSVPWHGPFVGCNIGNDFVFPSLQSLI